MLAADDPGPAAHQGLRTEYPFVLPRGYLDETGRLHRTGVMRLATAKDELVAHAEPQVRHTPGYLAVHLLSRTVTAVGSISPVRPAVLEGMFASDMAFLQDLYRRINERGHTEADVRCPECGHEFLVDVTGDGAS